MAVSGLLLAHRLRGLEVRGLVKSQIPENVVVVDSGDLLGVELRILTTHVDEIPRQIQIALLTGRIIQLRQRQFDFRMPISTVDLAVLRAEIGIDAIRHTARHVKRLLVTGHLMIGDSSLNIVDHDIHFMALLNQCETLTMRPFTGFDLVRSVQISVRLLRTCDEVDGFIAQFPQLRIRMIRQCVSRFLQPLIYVGILEDHAMKFTGLITGCDTQILHGMTFIIGKLIASRIIRNFSGNLIIHHTPLIGNDGFNDLVATLLPERRSNSYIHDISLRLRTSPALDGSWLLRLRFCSGRSLETVHWAVSQGLTSPGVSP